MARRDRVAKFIISLDEEGTRIEDFARKSERSTRRASRGWRSLGRIIETGVGVAIGMITSRALPALGRGIQEVVDRSSRVDSLARSFDSLASSQGLSADTMVSELRPASRGLISDMELMELTNNALTLGIVQSEEQWASLVGAAQNLGRAVGRDATQSVQDLTIALGRQSPRILDNLGIQLPLNEAYEEYAQRLGKTADELSDVEKRTAFTAIATERIAEASANAGNNQLVLGDRVKQGKIFMSNWVDQVVRGINRAPELNRQLNEMAGNFDDVEANGLRAAEVIGVALGEAAGDTIGILRTFAGVVGDNVSAEDQATTATERLSGVFGPFAAAVNIGAQAWTPYLVGAKEVVRVHRDIEPQLRTMAKLWGGDVVDNTLLAKDAIERHLRAQSDAAIQTTTLNDFLDRQNGLLNAGTDQWLKNREAIFRNTMQRSIAAAATRDLNIDTTTHSEFLERNSELLETGADKMALYGEKARDKAAAGVDEARLATDRFITSIRTGIQWLDNLISAVGNFVTSILGGGGFMDAIRSASGGLGGLTGNLAGGGRVGGLVGNVAGAVLGGGGGGGAGGILGGLFGGGGGGGGGGGLLGGLLGGVLGGGGQLLGGAAGAVNLGGSLGAGILSSGGGVAAAGGGGLLGSLGGVLGPLFSNPITAIAGGAIGVGFLLKAIFGGPSPAERVSRDAGKFLGIRISDGVAEAMATRFGKEGKDVGILGPLTFLEDIVAEQGPLSQSQFGKVLDFGLKSILRLRDEGKLSAQEFKDAWAGSMPVVLSQFKQFADQGLLTQTHVEDLNTAINGMLVRAQQGLISAADAGQLLTPVFPAIEDALLSMGDRGQQILNEMQDRMKKLGITVGDVAGTIGGTFRNEILTTLKAAESEGQAALQRTLRALRDKLLTEQQDLARRRQQAIAGLPPLPPGVNPFMQPAGAAAGGGGGQFTFRFDANQQWLRTLLGQLDSVRRTSVKGRR